MLEFHSNPPVATAGTPASSMLSLLNLNSLAARNMDNGGHGGNPATSTATMAAFVLGSPPLAALHSMTERKSAMLQHYTPTSMAAAQCLKNASLHGIPPNSMHPTTTSSATTTSASGTIPHGIDNILNRPSPLGAAIAASAAAAGAAANLARFNPGIGMSMPPSAWMGAIGKQLELARPIYWPGLQNLVTNPNLWRERISHSGVGGGGNQTDKDGKKKHTRPTFSGQQIFALEKTFEQTKYLAGPERAKLAIALGMTESQVKITFTREWVKGKRSTNANSALHGKDGHSVCRGLVSAVEYLIELEKLRAAECSECCHPGFQASYPVLPDIQRTPSEFLPFLRELPGGATILSPDQVDRVSSSSSNPDRRTQ